MRDNKFIWSDNWWIEKDTAWFIPGDGKCNAVFSINLETQECKYIAAIPEGIDKDYRLYSKCIKCGNDIYCMPCNGKKIWIYNMTLKDFVELKIQNPENKQLTIIDFWEIGNYIYAVSMGLKQIIEININEKKITNYYDISNDSNIIISGSTLAKSSIYILSLNLQCVYEFNVYQKSIKKHLLDNINGKLYKICFDGYYFWLVGYKREVYRWDNVKNEVKIFNDIPSCFGIYDSDKISQLDCKKMEYNVPAFYNVIATKNEIWFVPFQTNKILYLDKKSEQFKVFEIENEEETNLFNRKIQAKYIVQYVLQDGHIGLFSLKNECIYDIDVNNKKIKQWSIFFDSNSIEKLEKAYDKDRTIYAEESLVHRTIFKRKILKKAKDNN